MGTAGTKTQFGSLLLIMGLAAAGCEQIKDSTNISGEFRSRPQPPIVVTPQPPGDMTASTTADFPSAGRRPVLLVPDAGPVIPAAYPTYPVYGPIEGY